LSTWNGGLRAEKQDVICPHCGEKAGERYVVVPYADSGSSGLSPAGAYGPTWNELNIGLLKLRIDGTPR
jgi:hypothetical protein